MSRPPGSTSGRTADRISSVNVSRSLQQFRALNISESSRPGSSTPQLLPPLFAGSHSPTCSPVIPSPQPQSQPVKESSLALVVKELDSDPSFEEYEDDSSETTNPPKGRNQKRAPKSPELKDTPLPVPLHVIQAIMPPQEPCRDVASSTMSMVISEGEDCEVGMPIAKVPADAPSDGNSRTNIASARTLVGQWQVDDMKHPVVDLTDLPRDPCIDECDIDPSNGEFLQPVVYLEVKQTHRSESSYQSRDPEWRRWNMTADLYISRELARREKMKEEVLAKLKQVQVPAVPEEEPWPNAPCTLRPAIPNDFEQIAEIINLEIQQEVNTPSQIPSPRLATVSDVKDIYDTCMRNFRPFIVAVPSRYDPPDRSQWPKEMQREYAEFLKYKESKSASQAGRILGFAFVADSRCGFLMNVCPASRFTGQIRIVMHRSFRRKLVGTALLDKILCVISNYHRSLIDYEWKCSDPKSIYEYPSDRNRRKYNKVYIETFFAGEEDANFPWMSRMLKKFEFKRVAYFKEAARRGRHGGIWLDLVDQREERLTLSSGLDNAGKTTIVKKVMGEDVNTVSPTLGFIIKTIDYEGYKLNIWDVGGQKTLRSYWRNYFEKTDALIWVVDATDRLRIEDCREELQGLLLEERLAGASLLVFANKMDVEGCMTEQEILSALQLESIRTHRWHILPCSAMTGTNLKEGLSWVVEDAKKRLFLY
ncbi:hypothetical protein FDECE_14467 [Fusarium decemcellulare]|nr:hypothetical protein FDECE_14467 [Fusarium decemcellulare]